MTAVKYLSPSALAEFERCEHLFRLRRVDRVVPYMEPTPAMVAGKVFEEVLRVYHLSGTVDGAAACANVKADPDSEPAIRAVDAAEVYIADLWQPLQAVDIELSETFPLRRGLMRWDVPLLGYADALTEGGVLVDYKFGCGLTGRARHAGGWSRRWDGSTWVEREGTPLEVANRDWGTQLATYELMLGTGRPVRLEQVLWLGPGCISVAVWERSFPDEWYEAVLERYRLAWDCVLREEYGEGEPFRGRCVRYGSLCDGAGACSGYRVLSDTGNLAVVGL